jgi:hypothetical protein
MSPHAPGVCRSRLWNGYALQKLITITAWEQNHAGDIYTSEEIRYEDHATGVALK